MNTQPTVTSPSPFTSTIVFRYFMLVAFGVALGFVIGWFARGAVFADQLREAYWELRDTQETDTSEEFTLNELLIDSEPTEF